MCLDDSHAQGGKVFPLRLQAVPRELPTDHAGEMMRDEAASEEVTATPVSQVSRAILVGLQKQLEGMAVALPTA